MGQSQSSNSNSNSEKKANVSGTNSMTTPNGMGVAPQSGGKKKARKSVRKSRRNRKNRH